MPDIQLDKSIAMPFERYGIVFKMLVISVLRNTGKASNRAALAVAAGSEVTRREAVTLAWPSRRWKFYARFARRKCGPSQSVLKWNGGRGYSA